jgi:hypothetical protein
LQQLSGRAGNLMVGKLRDRKEKRYNKIKTGHLKKLWKFFRNLEPKKDQHILLFLSRFLRKRT